MDAAKLQSRRAYWDHVADGYDRVFPETLIGRLQRDAVWRELACAFSPGERILELNCGTGIDAVFLAKRGVRVLACDISPRMVEIARQRSFSENVASLTEYRVLPTEDIALLAEESPFDGVFSNFSGLNCVADLASVARNMAQIVRPGAKALFCMVGQFVPLESAWYLAHGEFSKAMGRRGTRWSTDGAFQVQFPSVKRIVEIFEPEFRLKNWGGIGIALPPSHLEPRMRRFPGLLNRLAALDRWIAPLPGFRNLADSVLLQFERL